MFPYVGVLCTCTPRRKTQGLELQLWMAALCRSCAAQFRILEDCVLLFFVLGDLYFVSVPMILIFMLCTVVECTVGHPVQDEAS